MQGKHITTKNLFTYMKGWELNIEIENSEKFN